MDHDTWIFLVQHLENTQNLQILYFKSREELQKQWNLGKLKFQWWKSHSSEGNAEESQSSSSQVGWWTEDVDPNQWESTEGKRNQQRISWSMIYDFSMIDWKQEGPQMSHYFYLWDFWCGVHGGQKQGQKLKDKVNFSAALKYLKIKSCLREPTTSKHSWPQDTNYNVYLHGSRR